MNRMTLRSYLAERGIPVFWYNLDEYGIRDERINLVRESDGWHVFYEERGVREWDSVFPEEESACDFIAQRLMKNWMEEMKMQNGRYIPLGSMVLLEGGAQKLMIVARAINVRNGDRQFFFDYGAVPYPQGLTGDRLVYFQGEAISIVVFEGFRDAEEINMEQTIAAAVDSHPELVRGTSDNWDAE